MKSGYPSAEQVLDDLGDKVAQGLALMVARTRADLALYRHTFPGWVADSTDRGLLNWCHDRAWAHAVEIFDDVPEVSFVDAPPTREIYVGTRYRMRVKSTTSRAGYPPSSPRAPWTSLSSSRPSTDSKRFGSSPATAGMQSYARWERR